MLAMSFDLETDAPPMKAAPVEAQAAVGRMRVDAVSLASDDDACAGVLLEEVYEPVLNAQELDSTLAGAFKLDAKIGNWQQEDPQLEAIALARELKGGFGDGLPGW